MPRIVLISDTHLRTPKLPDGDILIHCGDLTNYGNLEEFQRSEKWFKKLKGQFKTIFYVPGNHDTLAYTDRKVIREHILVSPKWLVDEEVYVHGLRIYGSPWTPNPGCSWWAYPLENDNKWDEIPEGLDILVTHGPPYDILDSHPITLAKFGSIPLNSRLQSMKQPPKYHVFGHCHAWGGLTREKYGIKFINAAICNEGYKPTNEIMVIDL